MRKRMTGVAVAVVLIVAATLPRAGGAAAQEGEKRSVVKKEMPAGWKMQLDQADAKAAEFQFWTMPPGWHITTGPAAIVYNPAKTASGNFRIESETFLFPGEHLEGVGVIFGGKNLELPTQSYMYFLIRKDGRFLIKVREGAESRTLVPWTAHAAIVPHDGTKQTAKNVLAVEAGGETVDFYVNGQKVHSLARAQVQADGVVGLRVNHHVNVHITTLNVTPR